MENNLITISTNNILRSKNNKGKMFYYVPAYVRLKVKNITRMNLSDLEAQVNVTLVITIFYGNLESFIVEKMLQKIVLLFSLNDPIILSSQDGQAINKSKETFIELTKETDKQIFTYSVRKEFKTRIQEDILFSPFQIINLIFSFNLKYINIINQDKKIKLCFNIMDNEENFHKIYFTKDGSYGAYNLAQNLLSVEFSNENVRVVDMPKQQKQKRQQQYRKFQEKPIFQSIINMNSLKDGNSLKERLIKSDYQSVGNINTDYPENFCFAHFTIPMYRYPGSAVATIFLPLWLLGLINLGVFFQGEDLGARIASIAALMIAFVALIPTIRQQIPMSSKIMLVQVLVYLQVSTCFLCLIHSVNIRKEVDYEFVWSQNWQFIGAASITIFNIVSVVSFYIYHKIRLQLSYNLGLRESEDKKFQNFDRQSWHNIKCDMHFNQMSLSHGIHFETIGERQILND